MSIFRDFFVKEKPVFTGITRGLGGFGFGAVAAAAPVGDPTPFNVEYIVLAGGGGGGRDAGGGGGAGGYRTAAGFAISTNTPYLSLIHISEPTRPY